MDKHPKHTKGDYFAVASALDLWCSSGNRITSAEACRACGADADLLWSIVDLFFDSFEDYWNEPEAIQVQLACEAAGLTTVA
jgi:hypothetical protein